MKTITVYFLSTILMGTPFVESRAQDEGEGAVLCRMLESSLVNPWGFDAIISAERKNFDKSMIQLVQDGVARLESRAQQREVVCKPFKNKFMGYDLCMANNPARKLATWLTSVSEAVNGSRWEQTEYGEGQLRIWNSCQNPAFCEQLRLAAAEESRQQCPLWFKN